MCSYFPPNSNCELSSDAPKGAEGRISTNGNSRPKLNFLQLLMMNHLTSTRTSSSLVESTPQTFPKPSSMVIVNKFSRIKAFVSTPPSKSLLQPARRLPTPTSIPHMTSSVDRLVQVSRLGISQRSIQLPTPAVTPSLPMSDSA